MASNSSWVIWMVAASVFSSRCLTEEVPGIGSMVRERRSSQATRSAGLGVVGPGHLR